MALVRTNNDPSGYERWEEPDGSRVEFRAAGGFVVNCYTYTSGMIKKNIGAVIRTRGDDFDVARIDSRYYTRAEGQVYSVGTDSDEDWTDSELDEHQSATWFGDIPDRVESLCRIQFRGVRLQATLTKGPLVYTLNVPPFPVGFPDTWPSVNAVTVDPLTLQLSARQARLSRKSVTVSNRTSSPQVVIIGATNAPFTVASGTTQIPAGEELPVSVTYAPRAARGSIGSFKITGAGRTQTVRLEGRMAVEQRGEER